MATAEQRFEADKKFAYRALQDARQYVTDFDRTGSKAEALYERLARAANMLYPWTTDGTEAQVKKAIEYRQEIMSILSDKIGPASRRAFSEQGGSRDHATKRQLQVGSRVELPPRSSYREPDPEVDFEGDTQGDVVKIKNDAAWVRMDSGRMDWFKIADLRLVPSGHSHAKKKSPAQLQREIDEVLAKAADKQ